MIKKETLFVVTLLMSLVSFVSSVALLYNRPSGPYFIDSVRSLSADPGMLAVNEKIAIQDEILKKNERAYDDSIARLLDSLSVRRGDEEILVDLMNLESNVYRHKKIDSIGAQSRVEVENAIGRFNEKAALFCQKNGIQVLFASSNNTIVYGTGEKADKTDELVKFLGSNNE